METGFKDVIFLLSLFEHIYVGTILVKKLYSVNAYGGGTQSLTGHWEWSPGCVNTLQNTCVAGIPTPTPLQMPLQGGWHWQRENNQTSLILTNDVPHSKNVVGAICDLKWSYFLTDNSGQHGFWLLNAGESKFGGVWRAGTTRITYPDRKPGERLEMYELRRRHLL